MEFNYACLKVSFFIYTNSHTIKCFRYQHKVWFHLKVLIFLKFYYRFQYELSLKPLQMGVEELVFVTILKHL